jgi:hypothetical protein
VADSGMDVSAGIEVGLGPVGILPGLRSLFQRAVGAQSANGALSEADNAAELLGHQPSQEPTSGSHLARTLGLHKDTPALAPFLGKQAIRRGIKEFDDGGVVDIDGFEEDNSQSAAPGTTDDRERKSIKGWKSKRWRMPYMHRNDVEPTTTNSHIVVAEDNSPSAVLRGEEQTTSNVIHSGPGGKSSIDRNMEETAISKRESTDIALGSGVSLPTLGTRFHFVARVVIVDRSLWIPLGSCHTSVTILCYPTSAELTQRSFRCVDRRQKTGIDHTHIWMISVESPSYVRHFFSIASMMICSLQVRVITSPLSYKR